MNFIKRWYREAHPEDWCSDTGFEQRHVLTKLGTLRTHFCEWDYCCCWDGYCKRCKETHLYSYGYDECR